VTFEVGDRYYPESWSRDRRAHRREKPSSVRPVVFITSHRCQRQRPVLVRRSRRVRTPPRDRTTKKWTVVRLARRRQDRQHQNWKGRFKDNSDKMRSGSIYEWRRCQSLTFLAKSKSLSSARKRMLDRAKFLIISEVSRSWPKRPPTSKSGRAGARALLYAKGAPRSRARRGWRSRSARVGRTGAPRPHARP